MSVFGAWDVGTSAKCAEVMTGGESTGGVAEVVFLERLEVGFVVVEGEVKVSRSSSSLRA